MCVFGRTPEEAQGAGAVGHDHKVEYSAATAETTLGNDGDVGAGGKSGHREEPTVPYAAELHVVALKQWETSVAADEATELVLVGLDLRPHEVGEGIELA